MLLKFAFRRCSLRRQNSKHSRKKDFNFQVLHLSCLCSFLF
ncbi:hypothetical protein DsansV1_C02g0023031 [Dioscorea sansibarensis]